MDNPYERFVRPLLILNVIAWTFTVLSVLYLWVAS